MNRTKKEEVALSIREKLRKASVVLLANYKGVTAVEMNDLRKQFRNKQVEAHVLKNNLLRIVAKENEFGGSLQKLTEDLVGPTLVAFSFGDASEAAKVLEQFAKSCQALEVKSGFMEGQILASIDVQALATIPSREVLLGQLLSVMNGPARGFVSVLAAVPRAFVTVLDAYQKKKEGL